MSLDETTVAQETDKQEVSQGTEQVVNTAATNVDFLSLIPEDLRNQGNLKDYKDIGAFAKSHLELQKMIGNSVRLPTAESSQEDREKFLNKIKDLDGILLKNDERLMYKLGKPEKLEDYKLDDIVPEDLKDIMNPHLESLKKTAFNLDLTQDQIKKFAQEQVNSIAEQKKAQLEARAKGEETLKKEWGDSYEVKLNGARDVAKKFVAKYGQDVADVINGPIGSHPAFINMMADLAESYKEVPHLSDDTPISNDSPEAARAKIMELRKDKNFMASFSDAKHPEHFKSVRYMEELYKKL